MSDVSRSMDVVAKPGDPCFQMLMHHAARVWSTYDTMLREVAERNELDPSVYDRPLFNEARLRAACRRVQRAIQAEDQAYLDRIQPLLDAACAGDPGEAGEHE